MADTPITLSALHFPSAEQSISQTLSSLRRSALSVTNRLRSIQSDASFVQQVADDYDLPLVANERCGSWYIPPDAKAGSAYFKSTDGHTGQWDFSFRRLNLQILPVAREHGGRVTFFPNRVSGLVFMPDHVSPDRCRCIIVDSTRRGKCKSRYCLACHMYMPYINPSY